MKCLLQKLFDQIAWNTTYPRTHILVQCAQNIWPNGNVHGMELCVQHIYVCTHSLPPEQNIFCLLKLFGSIHLSIFRMMLVYLKYSQSHAHTHALILCLFFFLSLQLFYIWPLECFIRKGAANTHNFVIFMFAAIVSCKQFHIRLHSSDVAAVLSPLSVCLYFG